MLGLEMDKKEMAMANFFFFFLSYFLHCFLFFGGQINVTTNVHEKNVIKISLP